MKTKQKITVIQPVSNDVRDIVKDTEHLRRVLEDLTQYFQIVLVDDCCDLQQALHIERLRLKHSQIDVVRLPSTRGAREAAMSGLALARGDFVFVQESYQAVDHESLRQLWDLREDKNVVFARMQIFKNEIDTDLIDSLTRFAAKFERHFFHNQHSHPTFDLIAEDQQISESITHRKPDGQLQMIRRDTLKHSMQPGQGCRLKAVRHRSSRIIQE